MGQVDLGAGDVGFAAASGRSATAFSAGWPVRLVGALQLERSFGLKLEARAAADLEAVAESRGCPAGGEVDVPSIDVGSQVVGLRVKPGRSSFSSIERTSSGMPWRIVGQRVGDGGDLGAFRVDVEGDADDHGAEVEGTGDGGDDHDQRERRALIGAGEVGVARDVERAGARRRRRPGRCRLR